MAATEELGLEVFVEGWKKFEDILDRLDKKTGTTGESMTKTGGIAGGAFAVALGNVAAKAVETLIRGLVKAGEAVVAFGVDSVKMAADFQSQMAILEIAASSTGLSFDQLHDAALAVGGDISLMGVSATGAADSMTGLFKAGLSNVEVFGDLEGYMAGTAELGGALRASIDLAAATELDMVQASDLAAIALASFGGEMETETERAEFINRAMNNFVQAADASVAEVGDLAAAIKMVGPAAGAAGIGIEDVNNALALLSTRGISGSMAGTSLNRMILDLGKTTPKATEMLNKLGISVYDTEGEMRPLVDIVGQFEDALGNATDAERDAALQAVFTAQGVRAMNVLLQEGEEGWNDMAEATANAATIQEQAEARGQTFNAQMEALEGTIETLKIGIGEQFLPIAQELATWFAGMVDEHGPALQAIFETIAGVIAYVADAMMQFVGDIDSSMTVVDSFKSLLKQFFPEETASALVDNFMKVYEGFREAWTFIQEQAEKVVAWFQENLPLMEKAGQNLADFWQYVIVPILDNVWEIIKTIVSTALDVILDVITLVMAIIAGDWEAAWTAIKMILIDITEAILSIAEEVMEATANVMHTTMEEIRATWKQNWETAKTIVTTIWENIKTAITGKLDEIVGVVRTKIEAVLTTISGFVGRFRSMGSDLIDALKGGIVSAASALARAAAQAVRDAIQAAKDALGVSSPSKVFFELGRSTMEGMALGVAQLAPVVQQQITAAITPVARPGGVVEGAHTEITNSPQFHLHTATTMRPGGLAMEFARFEMASR